SYDIDPPSREANKPLEDFLFQGRRGHCLYFATAMAVMLREVGVPSRVVSGFAGGTYNSFGRFYAVRGRDAHAWVEARVDGEGWRSFDPTPSGGPSRTTSGAIAGARDLGDALDRRFSHHVLRPSPGAHAAGRGWLALGLVVIAILAWFFY